MSLFDIDRPPIRVFETYEDVNGMLAYSNNGTTVYAKQMYEPFYIKTNHWDIYDGKAGDYLLKLDDGELNVCNIDTFESLYTPVAQPKDNKQ